MQLTLNMVTAATVASSSAPANPVTTAAQTTATTTPARPEIGSAVPKPQVGTLGGALVLVLALAVGVLWIMRRVSGGNLRRGGLLQVRDSVSVGQRERVVVVSAGGRDYVLGVAPGHVRHLDTVEGGLSIATNSEAAAPAAAPSFMAILERSLGRSK
ncbi:MAG: flagellar biosynthetic protein FliO [Abyssibacter sp.]|uniref:flagellar biosynthetic protein FliO n=1 Tax=Abyssibacter sp. TaxID=2320200 RepID=UPI00321C38A6